MTPKGPQLIYVFDPSQVYPQYLPSGDEDDSIDLVIGKGIVIHSTFLSARGVLSTRISPCLGGNYYGHKMRALRWA